MLNRNRRLLLWWSQQKKDVNDVNLQFDNGQSGHGPPRGGGAWPDCPPPWIRHWLTFDARSTQFGGHSNDSRMAVEPRRTRVERHRIKVESRIAVATNPKYFFIIKRVT